MFSEDKKRTQRPSAIRLLVVAMGILAVNTALAQDPAAPQSALIPQSLLRIPLIPLGQFAPVANAGSNQWQLGNNLTRELTSSAPAAEKPVRANGIRRITLEQVKQQRSADPVASPFARLGQLSIEAAKQHRLGVEADYFPKFGATFANLHFTDFLGQVLEVRRPLMGTLAEIPVSL